MKTPREFLLEVVKDDNLFSSLMLHAEEKQKVPTDFGTGLIMGWWLGRLYGQEEKHRSVCVPKNGNGGNEVR